MDYYHIGRGLELNSELVPDFKQTKRIVVPLIKTLEISETVFETAMLQARYTREIMRKQKLREWSDSTKWGTEAIFEYIRMREYPQLYSRLESNFFYKSKIDCEKLFKSDYVDCNDDDGTIFMYRIEVEDEECQEYDMTLFNKAYDASEGYADIEEIKNWAHKYWSGERETDQIIEILSNKKAIVKEKIKWG